MPLRVFICGDTTLTDLLPLSECKNLTLVQVTHAKVTPAPPSPPCKKPCPHCKIEWDDPAKPKTPEPAAAGSK